MVKASLLIMAVLTVLVSVGLRWREDRVTAMKPGPRRPAGWVATQKRALNRWLTAATVAAVATMLVLGGLHWVRVWQVG